MKKIYYKNFEINAQGNKKDGFSYIVIRTNDNWILGEGFYPSGVFENINESLEDIKILIDDYCEKPEDFEE